MGKPSLKSLLLSLTVGISVASQAYAKIESQFTLTGFVSSFDKDTVKLYVRGSYVTVPKNSIPKYFNVRIGNEVTAYVDRDRNVASEKSEKK